MVDLCERYGISRKTGDKWIDRYERDGPDGLRERSRAPQHCPQRISTDVAAAESFGLSALVTRGVSRVTRPSVDKRLVQTPVV